MIAPSILADYTAGIALVAGEQPATSPADFIDQLGTAARNLRRAGIHGAADLETAATYLGDAIAASGADRRVLLSKAVGYLASTADMVDEYRLTL